MGEFLNSWSPRILSVLRIITGFLFLWHGSQKLFSFPPPPPEMAAAPKGFLLFAGGLEFFGGLLILIGLFTRPVAFILSGMMAVAYWMGHGLTGKGFLPLVNGGELAVIYCFVFFYFFFAGGGPWSVDSLFKKNA
ncbi:MAG TPA: DoxX family protein [Pyrinomonadaceae bacterium]|jgi:putative oxidoreductase|nr:DoxX family protein [Pyrinomonadaceae bacterium]